MFRMFEDLPVKQRAKTKWQKVVMLIPRQRDDKEIELLEAEEDTGDAVQTRMACMDPYFMPLWLELQSYMPPLND